MSEGRNEVRPYGFLGQIAYSLKDFTIVGLPVAKTRFFLLRLPPRYLLLSKVRSYDRRVSRTKLALRILPIPNSDPRFPGSERLYAHVQIVRPEREVLDPDKPMKLQGHENSF